MLMLDMVYGLEVEDEDCLQAAFNRSATEIQTRGQ
jgi:hypothetical protein